jgi:L-ascorbate metabolism protein UlaG (beta-lactamase superfamily)
MRIIRVMKARTFQSMVFVLGSCLIASVLLLAAQDVPRFTRAQLLTNRELALTLSVSNALRHRIDVSSNLAEWSGLVTLPGAASSLQHTDSAAPYQNRRFYRAEQLTGTNTLTGDHLVTTNGEVIIHPINHASFVMSWNGLTIYNDPVGGSSPYAGLPKADLILVSHHHSDHLSASTIDAVRKTNTVIIGPLGVYNGLTSTLRSNMIVLAYGASTNVLGLGIEAVPGYNSNHPYGTNNSSVVTIGGRRIFISGDTGNVPEMRALTNIDVAFVCMNLPFTMDVSNAVNAVRAFQPKVVYPYHYSPSTPPSDVNQFKQLVGADLGIEVRLRKWY